MSGRKRKISDTEFDKKHTRNVKPKAIPMIVSVLGIKEICGEIMNNLIRPASEHDTPYKECTKTRCFCQFAFTFGALRMTSKGLYDVCKQYKEHVTDPNIATMIERIPIKAFTMPRSMLCVFAATYGYLEVMKYARTILKAPWFVEEKMSTFNDPFRARKTCTCTSTMTFFSDGDDKRGDWIVTANAAKHGHRDCLEYAWRNGCTITKDAFIHSAQNGRLECLRFFLDCRSTTCATYKTPSGAVDYQYQSSLALEEAVLSKNMECVALLEKDVKDVTHCTFHKCAQVGNLQAALRLKDFKNRKWTGRIPWKDKDAWNAAASNDSEDNLSYLRYLKETGESNPDLSTTAIAARKGSLNCLKYLISIGTPIDETTTAAAAAGGQFKCLEYLRSIDCPWDENTTYSACAAGSLECLKYAYENDCPMHEDACYVANNMDCLKYAHENGSLWSEAFIPDSIDYINDEDDYDKELDQVTDRIKYAVEHGCPLDVDCCNAAAFAGSLELLVYLREHGCPWDYSTVESVVRGIHDEWQKERLGKRLECMKYLMLNDCPITPDQN